MKKIIVVVLLVLMVWLEGCATLVSGSRQRIRFSSTPSGATVFMDDVKLGTTPLCRRFRRDREYQIKIVLEGYKTYDIRLTRKLNEWYLVNAASTGLIGFIVDPITGAIYRLSPGEIKAGLEKETVSDRTDAEIHLIVSKIIDPDWEKIGQLEKL